MIAQARRGVRLTLALLVLVILSFVFLAGPNARSMPRR